MKQWCGTLNVLVSRVEHVHWPYQWEMRKSPVSFLNYTAFVVVVRDELLGKKSKWGLYVIQQHRHISRTATTSDNNRLLFMPNVLEPFWVSIRVICTFVTLQACFMHFEFVKLTRVVWWRSESVFYSKHWKYFFYGINWSWLNFQQSLFLATFFDCF